MLGDLWLQVGGLGGLPKVEDMRQTRWVVVKIVVPFWVPIIIRPLIFRVPKKGP